MNFLELKEMFNEELESLGQNFENFPWENKDAYLSWLGQTYEYALRSTRILSATSSQFPVEYTIHANRFAAHAVEEKNHDKLLENDAKKLGRDIKDIEVFPESEAFHKSLYYFIYNGSPMSIYGWVLCLEGLAVKSAHKAYKKSSEAFGKSACTFLHVHDEADHGHLESALNAIKDLNKEDYQQIAHGVRLYSRLYTSILERIQSRISSKNIQKAA